jgi:hypothetical protein
MIVRHMNANINQTVCGEYDYIGQAICYSDTDSNVADTIHHTNYGPMTSEALFELCKIKWKSGDKEYSCDEDLKVLSFDPETQLPELKTFNYIYRHNVVRKNKWRVTDSHGNKVVITGDHSVMVERDGALIELKPRELVSSDVLISIDK